MNIIQILSRKYTQMQQICEIKKNIIRAFGYYTAFHNSQSWCKAVYFKVLALCAVGIFLYANTFNDPFHFDDTVTIIENKSIHYLPSVSATIKSLLEFQPSRFVTNFTFALNYYVHRFDVFGYHLVNLIVHLSTAFVVWWLGELLLAWQLKLSGKKEKARRKEKIKEEDVFLMQAPFVAALIFLSHPVNTQAVTYISQRAESLAALFYVLTVCLYIEGRGVLKKYAFLYFTAAFVCAAAATFSKETAITLPLAIVFVEFFLIRRQIPQLMTKAWILGLCLLSLVIIPAAFQFNYVSILFNERFSQSHLGDVLNFPTYVLTQFRVMMTFLRLLFLPVGLNLDYDYPMSHSLWEADTFLSLLSIIGILGLAFRFRRQYPMLAFAVFWFFLTLSANFIPRAHVVFEHKLYLAMAGVWPALCLGLFFVVKNRRVLMVIVLVVAVIFACLTVSRNNVWDSEISLWQDTIQKSPKKARVYLSLGSAYASAGKHDLALKYLTQASTMMGEPSQVFMNRGLVYIRQNNDGEALSDFNKAISISPNFADAYISRGEIFARRKEYKEAMDDFNYAIQLRPDASNAYKMRGRLYDAMQRYDLAMADYNHSILNDPGDAQAFGWRGYLYALLGKSDFALRDFEEALRLDPRFSDGYVYRGMYYKDRGQLDLAFRDLNKALEIKPSSAIAYYQRAHVWLKSGNVKSAMSDLASSLSLDQNYDLPYQLRARIYAQDNKLDLALSDLSQAITKNPRAIEAFLNRGLIYTMQGEFDQAIADFSQAIKFNPLSSGAYSRRASAYGHLKKYDLAIADFSKVIELNPNSGVDYYNRSVVFNEKYDRANALADALKSQALGFHVSENYLRELEAR